MNDFVVFFSEICERL